MTLRELNDKQLERVYRNLYGRVCRDGGVYGYEWPTIKMTTPSLSNSLRAVSRELNRRSAE